MNILIVKLSSLGDVVQTMPIVADILTEHPDAQIDWVVEEAFAPLVARVCGVRRVISIALRRWTKAWFSESTKQERSAFKKNLRAQTYDAVIDCQGLTKSALVARLASLTQYGLLGSFANKSDACGYEWPVKFLLPNNQPMPKRIHAIVRTRLLTSKMLGYVAQGLPKIEFKNLPKLNANSCKIMFTHGTTRPDNEWAFDNWLELAARLIAGGHQIVLPSSNAYEKRLCEALREQLGQQIHVLPRMGLPELLDTMAACQGVIGVDSGLSHMAVALGLPHVQIFSHDRAWRAGPLPVEQGGAPHQLAVGGANAPDVDAVLEVWQRVIAC